MTHAGSEDQAGRLRARVSSRHPRIVTVTSGKGGVGKTTVTANLGLELARMGKRVLMLDGDFGLANLAILFNLAPKKTLEDALAGRCRLHEIVLHVTEHLSLIPAASGATQLAEMPPTERGNLLREIGEFGAGCDLMLIDTGAGIGSTVQALVAMSDRTLLVTTHEPTALSDAYGLIKTVKRRLTGGGPRLDVVVNMAQSHVQARETHARLARLTERFLGFVPELAAVIVRDEAVGEAVSRQQPLTRIYPYAHATRAIASLARVLVDARGPDHATPSDTPLAVSVRR